VPRLSSKDLLVAARTLLVGRMVQAMVTPLGSHLAPDGDDARESPEYFWLEPEIELGGKALLVTLYLLQRVRQVLWQISVSRRHLVTMRCLRLNTTVLLAEQSFHLPDP
jgi:hypothetical protein